MTHWTMGLRKSSLIAVSALLSGLLLAGCDEYVQITRDPDVPIHKLATWAWRPVAEQSKAHDSRAVVSRDVISRDETVVRDSNADKDRKSTRLNSSHGYISYAVFCLKKKTHANALHLSAHPAVGASTRLGHVRCPAIRRRC